jgi:hypothetical protein
MQGKSRSRLVRYLALGLLGLTAPLGRVWAQEKAVVPAGGAVNITVSTTATAPPVSIILHERHGHVTPNKCKCAHTGGGLIDVASPAPDTVIITMSGAVIANSDMTFDFDQCFEVSFDDPKVKKAKLTLEGRVLGVLRGEKKGCADYSDASASVSACNADIASVSVPTHSACACESLGVNDHDGPHSVPVVPGKYGLHAHFCIGAHTTCCLCKRPSAEFAPDPALDPLWISYFDPFHGVSKKDFGFQVIVKVAPDTEEATGDKKPPEPIPAPTPAAEKR